MGRPQQRRVHAEPLRRPLRGWFGGGSGPSGHAPGRRLEDSDNVLQLDARKTEVSPERVPEPILTRQGRTDIKPASASGATHFVTQKWCSTSERAAQAVSVLTAGPCRARRARGSCGPQSHIMDLSTSNSAPGEDGSKPCSISQRAATRLRHDHHARITSRSTSVP